MNTEWPMARHWPGRLALLLLAALPALLWAANATAADAPAVGAAPGPAAAAGLAIPVNLLCTTCNDFLRCERDRATPAPGDALVYRLEEKTFWAQVATIGDYLVQLFRPKTLDQRPASVWRREGGKVSIERGLEATIDAGAHRIEVAGIHIDQRDGAWSDASGRRLGRCSAMTRRDGFALVRELLGRPAAVGSGAAARSGGAGAAP